ncbi:SCO1/SenC-domain-containing protein [Sporodiniella umbellata]|nr:SCO1/SenC-domain-containing protein [Sporodiniella umbellata]
MSFIQRFKFVRPYSLPSRRLYTTQPPRKVFTWKSSAILGMTAMGLAYYFHEEKEKLKSLQKEREKERMKSYGKPNIGTSFELYNCNQDRVTSSEELKGKFHMIYFGFTHCPDICPEELDKMAEVTDQLDRQLFVPVFITCDPLRDTAKVVKEYVKDFHPDLIGFTGDPAELKRVARSFRVYSYTPPDVKAEDDYLVDHSIFLYLMDPQGKFVDCYSRDTTSEEVFQSVQSYMAEYQK